MRQYAAYLRYWDRNGPERASQRVRNIQRIGLLRRFIAPGGVGAELGVHKGYFSPLLLDALAPEKLYLIDPWYLQGKQWTWGEGNRRAVDALCRTLRELEDELVAGTAVLRIDDDLEALARMADHHLDWAYVDTTHQYEQTARELALLKRKVKAGGIIAGDDWQPDASHRHHGVCKAVREFVDRERCTLLHADHVSMQWILRLA
jgi:Methyltransferase domain